MAMWDDREAYTQGVLDFLHAVDRGESFGAAVRFRLMVDGMYSPDA
jgi:hypothetical protein